MLGASGTIGSALIPLLAAEHDVVAVARRPPARNRGGATWVGCDVADERGLGAVLEGVEVAYHLVHSLGSDDFARRDREAAASVGAAAAAAGVRQIVYLGGLGDDSADLSEHLRSRQETAAVLARAGVPVTTLRSAIVIGRGSAAFETIVALVDRLPAMICPRWVSTPTQPVALSDVAAYLRDVAGLEPALGRNFDVGGPEVMTYRQMIERVAALRGRRPLIVEIPAITPRLSSYWLHLVTPVKASVARPLIAGLRNPTVVRDDAITRLLPRELTSFREAAAAALG